jgi:hypothetical protein
MLNIDAITRAYATGALWSSTDHAGFGPLDENYTLDDIAPETMANMRRDCEDFATANAGTIETTGAEAEQVGHDFWLTRNGHGAGFWDRGYGEPGEALSAAARACGGVDLYPRDDGLIHG